MCEVELWAYVPPALILRSESKAKDVARAAEMSTVLLCASFPFLPKLASYIKDPGSCRTSQARPCSQQVNVYRRSSPPTYSKSSLGADSENDAPAMVQVIHELPQPMPTWKPTPRRDDMYSPV